MAELAYGDGEHVRILCRALGIDPDMTTRVVIDIQPDSLVTVYVQRLVTAGQLVSLAESVAAISGDVKVQFTDKVECGMNGPNLIVEAKTS